VRLLLNSGADVNALPLSAYGTALSAACYVESIELVKLLEARAHVGSDNSALEMAVDCSIDIITILLDSGANIGSKGSAYHIAVEKF
jgi:hypothetical protein